MPGANVFSKTNLGFFVRGKSASYRTKACKSVWLGEMQILSAIFVLLPQTVAANKATACVGGEP
jgi:hypothetical protein